MPATGTPLGTVTIYSGGTTVLCTTGNLAMTGATTSSATCALTNLELTAGTYPAAFQITATYNPATVSSSVPANSYTTSASAAQTLTIT